MNIDLSYLSYFLVGLSSGGVACAAMQGGLLASVIANAKTKELETKKSANLANTFDFDDWAPVVSFLSAKWVAHLILGGLLGLVGASITFSTSTKLFFQGFSALFMLATAANLLDLHPIFRHLSFSPPRFARKLIKNNASTNSLFAPAVLGLLTIFVPCGVTQAMAVIAMNTSSLIGGSLVMASFVAGTIPIFLFIGIATAKFSEILRTYFLRFAAIILVFMALQSINGILIVLDSPLALHFGQSQNVQISQRVTIEVKNNGYNPNYFKVRANSPVELTLKIGEVYTCAASFNFRAFNIETFLKPNSEQTFTFTPLQKGKYTFSCSMGSYQGTMEVI